MLESKIIISCGFTNRNNKLCFTVTISESTHNYYNYIVMFNLFKLYLLLDKYLRKRNFRLSIKTYNSWFTKNEICLQKINVFLMHKCTFTRKNYVISVPVMADLTSFYDNMLKKYVHIKKMLCIILWMFCHSFKMIKEIFFATRNIKEKK